MKLRDTFALALLFFISMSYGQEGFYYQAVIRNIDGSPMRNTPIQLKLSLLNSDTVLFEESHDLETNANGLIHTTLSSGEVISGDWNSINWSQTLSLKEEISRDGSIITQTIKSILKAPRAYIADKALALVPASIHAGHIVDQALSNDHIAENAQIAFNKLAISRENIEELGVSSGVQYTAGTNVTITEEGVISAVDTDTRYSAGVNVSIDEDNVISVVDTNTTYSAGTNIYIDGDHVISATDTDTNTTYTLSFAGSTLTLTDSDGVATDIDLASLDTDTDTTYTAGTNVNISDSGEISSVDTNTEYIAGTNVSIDANNVINAEDTNTTYSAGINISIDEDHVISAVDTDTNTTYALSFAGSTLTLTDSDGVATDIDLASLDTDTDTTYSAGTNVSISDSGEISSVDTNTEYTAGNNVSIDANNVISAVDTDTTYSAGTNISIDGDNVISATDTDTNTTYALSFTGSTLTLTDSDGVATDIDLTSLDTDTDTTYTAGTNVSISDSGEISSMDTNTEYTAGTNVSIDANNVISAVDTDTTYSAGTGIEITAQTISIDNSVVTNNYQGSIIANSFIGDGSSLTNLTIPDDAITTAKIVDSSITSDKIDSSVDYISGIANNTITDYTNGKETIFTNSGNSGNFSLFLTGSSSVTSTDVTAIALPSGYTVNNSTMIFITKTTLENAGADIISENDLSNNVINVKATSNGAPYPLTITFNFMIVNFDY